MHTDRDTAGPATGPTPASSGWIRWVLVAVLIMAAGLSTCADPAGPGDLPGDPDRIAVALGSEPSSYPRDPWELVAGAVEEDTLRLEVRYSGGCREHDFRLVAVNAWDGLHSQGPLPTVAVDVLLAHEDRDDACDAIVATTLRFGLDPLRQAFTATFGNGPARLMLRLIDGRRDGPLDVYDWFVP
jgi:hypothetical protein